MCAVANKASRDTARRVAAARLHQAEAGQYRAGEPRPFGFGRDGTNHPPGRGSRDRPGGRSPARRLTFAVDDTGLPKTRDLANY